jgi:hypothetical protein
MNTSMMAVSALSAISAIAICFCVFAILRCSRAIDEAEAALDRSRACTDELKESLRVSTAQQQSAWAALAAEMEQTNGAECARAWFAERYADPGVFVDGAEALTLEAACQLVADAQAAERERWTQIVQQVLDANADAPPSVLLTPRQECAWNALRLFMAARSEGPNVGAKQPTEEADDRPRRDDGNARPERPGIGCRSGSA